LVTRMKSRVPSPFMKRTTAGLIPNRKGTSTDAPNMANMCWMLKGIRSRKGTLSSTWMIVWFSIRNLLNIIFEKIMKFRVSF